MTRITPSLTMMALVMVAACLTGCVTDRPLGNLSLSGGMEQDQGTAAKGGDSMLAIADRTLITGDTNSALDLYRQAAGAGGDNADALLRLGQVLFSRGEYDYAAGAFGEALIRQPRSGEALRGLGVSQLAQGRLDDAEKNIEQAVRDDTSVRSVQALAVLRMLEGEPGEAGMIYKKALVRWPQDLNLRSNYALSDALADNCDRGLKTGRDVATSPFARPQHVASYALVLALCGRDQEARDFGRKVMSDGGVDKLLQQATAARQADNPAARAAIVGVVPATASGVMAPEGKRVDTAGAGEPAR